MMYKSILPFLPKAMAAAITGMACTLSSPADAATSERVEQLEPGNGEWQLQLDAQLLGGGGNERVREIELYRGISPRIAIGLELETVHSHGKLEVEGVALAALFNLTGSGERMVGMIVKVGVDQQAKLAGLESLLIVGMESGGWRTQANLILRYERADGGHQPQLSYAGSLERRVSKHLWLGFEGSGQAWGFGGDGGASETPHFAGPKLTVERELAGRETEFGIAYVRGLAGAGAGSLYVTSQMTF